MLHRQDLQPLLCIVTGRTKSGQMGEQNPAKWVNCKNLFVSLHPAILRFAC